MLTFQVCIKLWKKNKSKHEKSPLHCPDKMPVDSMLPLKPGLRWLDLTRADNVTPRQHSRTYKIPNSTNTYILTEYFSSRQLIGVIYTNLNQPHSTHPLINILWKQYNSSTMFIRTKSCWPPGIRAYFIIPLQCLYWGEPSSACTAAAQKWRLRSWWEGWGSHWVCVSRWLWSPGYIYTIQHITSSEYSINVEPHKGILGQQAIWLHCF